MQEIRWRGSKAELRRLLKKLPRVLSGHAPDPSGLVQGLQLRMGSALLGKIQEAFVVKSEGGTDEMGVKWAPLSPVTLALRRHNTSGKALGRLREAAAGKMSEARKAQVRDQFGKLLSVLEGRNPGAKRRALGILERMKKTISPSRYQAAKRAIESGKPEKVAKVAFAGSFARILRDTGVLFNSLSPGTASPGRVLRAERNVIIVGTNVVYAKYHNSPLPRKQKKKGGPILPRRQFLPDSQHQLPKAWWAAMKAAFNSGVNRREFWTRYLGRKAR